jgi:beta-phosphoglucomutase-like phosphatase (HAD superfamily)
LQRRAYNEALKLNNVAWCWNIGTYCNLLQEPGGKKRLSSFGGGALANEVIEKIHNDKQEIFEDLVKNGIEPRSGCPEAVKACKALGIKLGFITTTTPKTIAIIKEGLSSYIDFEDFDLITSNQLVKQVKPNAEVYEYALDRLKVTANETIAIEDTKANQSSANLCGINCYLFPGEYAPINYEDMLEKKFIIEKLELSKILD